MEEEPMRLERLKNVESSSAVLGRVCAALARDR